MGFSKLCDESWSEHSVSAGNSITLTTPYIRSPFQAYHKFQKGTAFKAIPVVDPRIFFHVEDFAGVASIGLWTAVLGIQRWGRNGDQGMYTPTQDVTGQFILGQGDLSIMTRVESLFRYQLVLTNTDTSTHQLATRVQVFGAFQPHSAAAQYRDPDGDGKKSPDPYEQVVVMPSLEDNAPEYPEDMWDPDAEDADNSYITGREIIAGYLVAPGEIPKREPTS